MAVSFGALDDKAGNLRDETGIAMVSSSLAVLAGVAAANCWVDACVGIGPEGVGEAKARCGTC